MDCFVVLLLLLLVLCSLVCFGCIAYQFLSRVWPTIVTYMYILVESSESKKKHNTHNMPLEHLFMKVVCLLVLFPSQSFFFSNS